MIKIEIEKSTRKVFLDRTIIGNDLENLQDELVFSFRDTFVTGAGRLDYELPTGEKGYIPLRKNEESYLIPLKNVLMKEGQVYFQLVITQTETEEGIPLFKSNTFHFVVTHSINAEEEAPEDYQTWIDVLEEKIAEVERMDIDIEEEEGENKVVITRKDGTTKEATLSGGGSGGTSDHSKLNNLDYERSGHTGFQKELISGINIKTLNNQDMLGEGNIDINSAIWGNIAGSIQNQTDLQEVLEDKASKDFVNSSVATATGTFKGTFDNLQELLGTQGSKNDYAFYQEEIQEGERVYHRYKHNGEQWLFEYSLNDNSFTAEQWATINSGLTRQSLDGKQDLLISGYNIKTINNQDITGDGNIDVEGVTDHSELENLDFEHSGHTGFQKQLKAGPNIIIDIDGTISASAEITETEFEMWYEEEVESWR